MTADKAECRSQIEITITTSGICHGFIGWFQTRVGDQWLSTAPDEKDTHWGQAFLPLDPPITVGEGQILIFDLNRPEHGEWSWTVKTGNQHQRHSTFLSKPLLPSDMQKQSTDYAAMRNNKGEMALYVLKSLDGNKPTSNIAASLLTAYPDAFSEQQHAEQFVIDLVQRYS
jgi:hypothetical protein